MCFTCGLPCPLFVCNDNDKHRKLITGFSDYVKDFHCDGQREVSVRDVTIRDIVAGNKLIDSSGKLLENMGG